MRLCVASGGISACGSLEKVVTQTWHWQSCFDHSSFCVLPTLLSRSPELVPYSCGVVEAQGTEPECRNNQEKPKHEKTTHTPARTYIKQGLSGSVSSRFLSQTSISSSSPPTACATCCSFFRIMAGARHQHVCRGIRFHCHRLE